MTFKIISKIEEFKGHFSVLKYSIQEDNNNYFRDIVETKDAVFVLPFDSKNKKVILINEKRFGLLKHRENIETWSSVSGTVDKDVSLEEIVGIELKEEANLDINNGKLTKILSHFSSPGIISEQKTIYLFDFDSSKYISGEYGSLDENEKTISKLFTYNEALKMIDNGQIEDLNCIFSLFTLLKN